MTVLATLGVVAVLAGVYFMIGRKSSGTEQPSQPAAAAASANKSTHPLAKYLELVGLRVKEGQKGAMSLGFIIVNHSAADMPDLKIKVTLRSDKKQFAEFPFDVPPIAAFESKDFSVPLKTELKPYELPDWQFLNADFEITSAP